MNTTHINDSNINKTGCIQQTKLTGLKHWASTTMRLHKFMPTPSNSGQGVCLSRRAWTRLNRLRTGVGRFGAKMLRCGLTSSDTCICGAEQTADHITSGRCPLYHPSEGMNGLIELDIIRRGHGSRTVLCTYEWCVMAHARRRRTGVMKTTNTALTFAVDDVLRRLILIEYPPAEQRAYETSHTARPLRHQPHDVPLL